MQRLVSLRTARIRVAVVFALFTASCAELGPEDPNGTVASSVTSGDDPATGPTGVERLPQPELTEGSRYNVQLGMMTDYLDGHPDIESMDFDGDQTITLRAKPGRQLHFVPGRILLSRDHIFNMRVLDVYQDGQLYTYSVEPATVEQTFSLVDIEAVVPMYEYAPGNDPNGGAQKVGLMQSALTILNISSSKTKSKTFSFDETIINRANLDVSIQGDFDISYTFYLKIYVATGSANEFKSWIRFTADSDLEAFIEASASASAENEKSVASWQVPWAFGVVAGVLDMDLVLNYGAEVNGSVEATAGLGFDDLGYKVGAEWKKGSGWSKLSEKTTPTWNAWFDTDAKVYAEAYLYPAVEVALLIYGIAGPEMAIGPKIYGKFRAQSGGKFFDVCAELDLILKAEANFVVDILGFLEIVEKNFGSWNIYTWNDVVSECMRIRFTLP